MDENLHNIEDLFHSALDENMEEAPSRKVWDGINKRLDKDDITRINRKYRTLKIASIALLLLLGASVYKLNINNLKNKVGGQDKAGLVKNKAGADRKEAYEITTQEQVVERMKSEKLVEAGKNNDNALMNNSHNNKGRPIHQSIAMAEKDDPFTGQNIIALPDSEKNMSAKGRHPQGRQSKEQVILYHVGKKIISSFGEAKTSPVLLTKNQYNDATGSKKIKFFPAKIIIVLPAERSMNIQPFWLSALSETNSIKSGNKLFTQNKQKRTGASRFSITPFFSPDIVWYHLEDDKLTNRRENAREIERDEKHEFSYTLGILADYSLGKHWGLQSGITYANTDISTQPKSIYAQQDNAGNVKYRINTSSGYGYILPSYSNRPSVGDSLFAFTATYSLRYFSIPLALTYNIVKGRIKFNLLAGVSTNILMKARLEATLANGNQNSVEAIDNLEGIKKFYLSGLAGIGVEYKIYKNAAFIFAPVMRLALNSINQDVTVKSYPMSIGFSTGLKINL